MKKILVVNDSQDILYYLKTLLEASEYKVAFAYEGAEALEKLALDNFDLIISDILMPEMDGLRLCYECGKDEKLRDIPFVFYTATYTDEMDEELALQMGAATFIRKPVEPAVFLEKIEGVMKEGSSRLHADAGQGAGEGEILRLYNESLIHKLEQKNLALQYEVFERQKTEAALSISAKSFKTIFEQAAIGVAEIESRSQKFVKINQRYCDITGYSQNELLNVTFVDITHPDDLQLELDNMSRINGEEIREFSMEKRYLRKDGEIVWVILTVSPVWSPKEKPTTYIATIHDITAQKLAEEELRKSEEHLRTVLENEPECVKILGKNGELLEMNRAGLEMIEADSFEEVRGQKVLNLVAPEFRESFSKLTRDVLGGSNGNLEFEVIGLKGGRRWLETTATPMRDKLGKVTSLLGVTRDVTERKDAESIIAGQRRVLEMVALGEPLKQTLNTLAEMVETLAPEMLCSILLLDEDGKRLRSFVAPSLPEGFVKAIDGGEIGQAAGSCGTAAYCRETVIVEDIATDSLWTDYRDLALKFGLLACWSSPILDAENKVLGTFAIYFRRIAKPTEKNLEIIELMTGLAAIAITRAGSEAALRNSERRLKDAQVAGRIGDWEFDLTTGRIDWSDSLYEIYGKDKVLGPPSYEEQLGFYVSEDAEKLDKFVRRAMETGESYELDLQRKMPNGEVKFVSAIGKTLTDAKGKVLRLYGIAQDITERKTAEEFVRYQAHLLDTVQQSVAASDPYGIIVYWNRFAEKLYGWSADEAIGQHVFKMCAPEFGVEKTEKIFASLNAGKSWEGEYEALTKSGYRISVSVSNSPITGKNGNVIGFIGISQDITERKRSDAALIESEERLRTLFDQMIDGFYYSSGEGTLLDINPAMVKMFGYSSKEEMLKVDVKSDLYFSPEDRIKRNTAEEVEKMDVYRMRRKDGSEIWVEDNGRYVYDDKGNIRFHEGVLRDVTERVIAESHLRKTSERLAISQQVAKVGTFEWDIKENLVYWSTSMEELFGLEPGEFTGGFETWNTFIHPDDLEENKKSMKIAIEDGVIYDEYRVILHDGSIKWVHTRAKVFYDNDGTALRMVGVHMDVTDRKESEAAVAEANVRAIREYENLLDILSKLAQTIGSARDINAIFSAIVKFTTESVPCDALIVSLFDANKPLIPTYFWCLGQERDIAELANFHNLRPLVGIALARSEVAVANLPLVIDLTNNGDESGHSGSALVAPMKIKGAVVGVIEVQSDDSDAFQNEHRTAMRMVANLVANSIENVRLIELEHQREEQLQRSQKLESVGRLAGGVAHDFNNMLTAINGYSELILKRISDDDPVRNNVLEIKKAGERSADLTRQLLAFSRKQVLQLKVLSLNDIVSETTLMLERLIGEDLILDTKLGTELGLIESDPGQLSQVIINLAVNARDAMPNGGILSIETSNVSIENDLDQNPQLPPTGLYVQIFVSDSGVGMDTETLESIFEPFFTTKTVGKGTGLGLATVYGIVKQSNGFVFVDSSINEGTTFRVYFPRVDQHRNETVQTEVFGSVIKGSETILIVEDEAMVRSLTRQVLEECGYTIHEAGDGAEALEICESLNFQIDLVLTDVVMPKMGGRELGTRLNKLHPELPILFTSGYADDVGFGDFITETESNFIPKPFTFEALAVKVRDFLDIRKQIKNKP